MITRPARNPYMVKTRRPFADSGTLDAWNDDGGYQQSSPSRIHVRHQKPIPAAIFDSEAINVARDGDRPGVYVLLIGLPLAIIVMTLVNILGRLF